MRGETNEKGDTRVLKLWQTAYATMGQSRGVVRPKTSGRICKVK